MSKRIQFLIFWILMVHTGTLMAQSPDPSNYTRLMEVLPASPTASSLGKYGGIDLNLSSGALNLDIPIYEYSSTRLKLPISLSYNSNGIRVNEVAPSTGMSWALNGPGVITRTVYGMPDELRPRLSLPHEFPDRDTAFVNFLYDIGNTSLGLSFKDGQPDLFSFSFNGYNGKFILDSTLTHPQLLTYSGIRIESQFNQANPSGWHFRITTPEGIQYYFGGATVEKSKSQDLTETGVQKNLIPEVPTAFYLNEIIHPDHDTIWLSYISNTSNYTSNISETMFGNTPISFDIGACMNTAQAPVLPDNSPKISTVKNENCLFVQQITSSGGARLWFNYTTRKDIDQLLLSNIQVFQPNQISPFKVFSLNYQYAFSTGAANSYETDSSYFYRPFLVGFTEHSSDSSLAKSYKFQYNNIHALPPRLSYSQDDYGFYNGKNNSTLLPFPVITPSWSQYLPGANANRGIDTNYCLTGLLTKVTYPTSGQDSIVYESNSVYATVPVDPPAVTAYALAQGSIGFGAPVYDTISVQFGQLLNLTASCYYYQINPNPDSLHDLAGISLFGLTGADSGHIVIQANIPIGGAYQSINLLYLPVGTYRLELQASGTDVAGAASLNYMAGILTYENINEPIGGNRVKRVISIDPVTNNQSIKRYYYGPLSSLNNSSATLIYQPVYEKTAKFYVSCAISDGLPDFTFAEFDYPSIFSSTQFDINAYGTSPVSYSAVTESFGENFENGGIEHYYTSNPDIPGQQVLGDNILGAPRTSYSYINGKETYRHIFRNVNGSFTPVKKVYIQYKEDTRVDSSFSSYLVNMKYTPLVNSNPPDQSELTAYDLLVYNYLQKWIYPDTVRTLTYDNAGQNYNTNTEITQYANPSHALPTQISSTLSDGRTQVLNNYYPADIVLTGNAETARQSLLSKYIISPVLQEQLTKGGNTVFIARTDYNVFPNGLTLPATVNVQNGTNPIEKRVEYTRYNNKGGISEQSKENDMKQSYLWDYNQVYSIAQVKNADSASIAYTSFEANGTGNWTIPSAARDSVSAAITGSKSYILSTGAISKSGLTSTITYIVSYWSRTGSSYTVTGSTSVKQGKTINGWTYFEHTVSGVTSITISGSSNIDELRLYPSTAQMTTYTYTPLVGISSQCDADNRITYYFYDALQRLKWIKDQDGNIIKTIQYHFRGQ